jgi:hypothetical protein
VMAKTQTKTSSFDNIVRCMHNVVEKKNTQDDMETRDSTTPTLQ